MNRYNIRKFHVWPAFKFGAIIGAVLMVIPGIVNGLIVHSAVADLRALIDAMGGFAALGGPDTAAFARQMQTLVDMGPLIVLWTTLLTIILGGLWSGIMAALAAVVYNLVAAAGGGLEVNAQTVGAAAVPQVVPVAPQPQIAPALQAAPQYPPVVVPAMQAAPPVQGPVAQPVQTPPAGQPSGPWLGVGDPGATLAQSTQLQRRPLRPDRTRLGSAPDNDIVLAGATPRHAEIRFENGVYVLYDLAAGQTWVNGRPVAGRNMLKEGFVIRLGAQEMMFHAA